MFVENDIQSTLENILYNVEKPGRYTGGELNQVIKDWTITETKIALVFPDIYDIGMSNLGIAILYDQINRRNDALAERAFSPWIDMEKIMREKDIPLYSLETKHPLSKFDIIAISLPYETLYTNTLNLLNLANIPLFTHTRRNTDPLVIAGGHATYNPEPMHQFIDAFVIGEGEQVIHEIIETYQNWKISQKERSSLMEMLSQIWGVYVPSLFKTIYNPDNTFSHIEKNFENAPLPILKRIVSNLPTAPVRLIVPYIETVHDRIPIEIMRGCTRGCRFCHAGMITRPVRERSVKEIIEAIEEAIQYTGYEEVALLSLSSSDYSNILELINAIQTRFEGKNLSISLPSLRIDTISVDLMQSLRTSRGGGFTLAPEAATEKMRLMINKPLATKQLIDTCKAIYSRGWPTIKLYFMIGHPSETIEDVKAIADLCKVILAEGRSIKGKRAKVHVGISTFIPKPHTPFQWESCASIDQIKVKQNLLKNELRGKNFKITWTNPEQTILEAFLSRGDRHISDVIYEAWVDGAKFDAWNEHFNFTVWRNASIKQGIDIELYTHRKRDLKEIFPWDHINTAIRKEFLIEDYSWSLQSKERRDCREICYACGILPTFSNLRNQNNGQSWKCPELKSH